MASCAARYAKIHIILCYIILYYIILYYIIQPDVVRKVISRATAFEREIKRAGQGERGGEREGNRSLVSSLVSSLPFLLFLLSLNYIILYLSLHSGADHSMSWPARGMTCVTRILYYIILYLIISNHSVRGRTIVCRGRRGG